MEANEEEAEDDYIFVTCYFSFYYISNHACSFSDCRNMKLSPTQRQQNYCRQGLLGSI